jgi:Zn-dependent protease with chaperone function
MDFYSRQAAARSQSHWLVIGFFLALLAVALSLDVVLFTFMASGQAGHPAVAPLEFAATNPGVAVFSTLLVMGVLGLASFYKSLELRGGGGVVARSLGGVLVAPDTIDPRKKRLLNVVSEMAIASGVPMPEVYVLEQEQAINAFAAGHTPANAAVTVTQGALERLNRDELQGVIGHEFSHILNGDMRLNVQLMGWLFGLFVVALIGRLIVNFSPRNRRDNNNGIIALGFAVMVLGYVGLFLGRMLQSAVSRQRERLADASGVQFTRNPQGLKAALVKIAALPDGSILATPHAEQAAHMFFADGLNRLFATHPPLLERIRELDPQFDESEIARVAAEMERSGEGHMAEVDASAVDPDKSLRTTAAASSFSPAAVSSLAGSVAPQHFEHARAIYGALPEIVRDFQSPGRAQAFVLALLLSKEPATRRAQLQMLGQTLSVANFAVIQQIAGQVDALDPMMRLPALQQLFPSLRRAPLEQRQALAQVASRLIFADGGVDPFEFSLAKLLETLLNDDLSAAVPHGNLSVADAEAEIRVLLATLAQVGANDRQAAEVAFDAGTRGLFAERAGRFAPLADWPRQLSEALPKLDRLEPLAKKGVIDAMVRTISSDSVMTEAESELLRTVCALLHCPLPAGAGLA